MSEHKIQEFLNMLFNAKYTSDHVNCELPIISGGSKNTIETIIRNFLLDNRDEKLGILESKVFTYEQIISKSNFSPMLIEDNKLNIEVEFQREKIYTESQVRFLFEKVTQVSANKDVFSLFDNFLCIHSS